MHLPKRYGQSRIEKCPFCERQGIIKNSQGIPTCSAHKSMTLDDLKCTCGRYLFIQEGKFGVFFICTHCGNLNLRKVLEINSGVAERALGLAKVKAKAPRDESEPPVKRQIPVGPRKEITIRSDDPDYF
jgi:hypothetical protein